MEPTASFTSSLCSSLNDSSTPRSSASRLSRSARSCRSRSSRCASRCCAVVAPDAPAVPKPLGFCGGALSGVCPALYIVLGWPKLVCPPPVRPRPDVYGRAGNGACDEVAIESVVRRPMKAGKCEGIGKVRQRRKRDRKGQGRRGDVHDVDVLWCVLLQLFRFDVGGACVAGTRPLYLPLSDKFESPVWAGTVTWSQTHSDHVMMNHVDDFGLGDYEAGTV